MTQTPRDWQKDMEMCERFTDGHIPGGPLDNGKAVYTFGLLAKEALPYWLQEAKTLQDKLKELVEIIEYEADLADLRGAEIHARELRSMVATLYPDTTRELTREETDALSRVIKSKSKSTEINLYPDTPAPKEGNTE